MGIAVPELLGIPCTLHVKTSPSDKSFSRKITCLGKRSARHSKNLGKDVELIELAITDDEGLAEKPDGVLFFNPVLKPIFSGQKIINCLDGYVYSCPPGSGSECLFEDLEGGEECRISYRI